MNRIDRQHILELKIPPAVLVAFTGALIWLASAATSATALMITGRRWVTAILLLTRVGISGLGFSNPNAYGLVVAGNSSATSSNWWR